jgi:FkbM family methyltransferase
MHTTFRYYGHTFNFTYDPIDASGMGGISEIVRNNEYHLNKFMGEEGKVFVDIGGNMGVATIIMAKLNPNSTVYTFEPCVKSYGFLVENVRLNGLTNVKTFNLGVADSKTKSLTLTICDNMSGASSAYCAPELFNQFWHTENNRAVSSQEIQCISFDEILSNNNITDILLLKIDCEGAEYDIIYDSEQFKTGIVKNLVGEFHNLRYIKTEHHSSKLVEYCKTHVSGIVSVKELDL